MQTNGVCFLGNPSPESRGNQVTPGGESVADPEIRGLQIRVKGYTEVRDGEDGAV